MSEFATASELNWSYYINYILETRFLHAIIIHSHESNDHFYIIKHPINQCSGATQLKSTQKEKEIGQNAQNVHTSQSNETELQKKNANQITLLKQAASYQADPLQPKSNPDLVFPSP